MMRFQVVTPSGAAMVDVIDGIAAFRHGVELNGGSPAGVIVQGPFDYLTRGRPQAVSTPPSSRGLTLAEARQIFFSELASGTTCLCCDRKAAIRPRQPYKGQMIALLKAAEFFRNNPTEKWLHFKNYMLQFKKDAARVQELRHWGLIERKPGEKEDGNPRNGMYRVTDEGMAFVEGRRSVPRYAYIYNDAPVGFSDGKYAPTEFVDVYRALGKNFNYKEDL
jgi:hypothetical protein